jgi:hypothetical protein
MSGGNLWRNYVQEGDQEKLDGATREEFQTDEADQKALIQIEPLVCDCCAVDRGVQRSKMIATQAE